MQPRGADACTGNRRTLRRRRLARTIGRRSLQPVSAQSDGLEREMTHMQETTDRKPYWLSTMRASDSKKRAS